ncbi:hypothetical protein ACOJQI_10160 [Bacillus salacetis]|uniref:hypothetical protein n=1 Tax=Bacillus salacetis TaxID=2315464 RepID=UPI003B9DDAD5
MKRKIIVLSLMLFLSLCMAGLSFPADSEACQCNNESTEGQPFFHSKYIETASVDHQIGKDEDSPLFENVIIYLIIFIPVVVVTLIVWIFSRILKLTKEKESKGK